MRPIARLLAADGYAIQILGYPSTRLTIAAIAEQLAPAVADFAAGIEGPVHFVTHSLGGLIARAILSTIAPQTSAGL